MMCALFLKLPLFQLHLVSLNVLQKPHRFGRRPTWSGRGQPRIVIVYLVKAKAQVTPGTGLLHDDGGRSTVVNGLFQGKHGIVKEWVCVKSTTSENGHQSWMIIYSIM